MPIAGYSGAKILENIRYNREHHWSFHGTQNRLEPVAHPRFDSTFKLEPGEKITTIGSCFARNIETRLAELGFDIPAYRVKLPMQDYSETFMAGPGFPNAPSTTKFSTNMYPIQF